MTRDQYIQKLKADLDRWSGQTAEWEEVLRTTRGEERAQLQRQLDAWRDQRNLTVHTLREMRVTSSVGWEEMARNADQAWRELAETYQRTREAFAAPAHHA